MITVVKPGLLTTVQDLGRYGYQKFGVIVSGAMDHFAHTIANYLVGNDANEATLEITLVGPELIFKNDALISICGANISPMINGKPVPTWHPIFLKAGCKLTFGPLRTGCRTYLAIAGGINIPEVMRSKSTYLRANIGGIKGRPLQKDDRISVGKPSKLGDIIMEYLQGKTHEDSFAIGSWTVPTHIYPWNNKEIHIRVMRGYQFSLFTKESQKEFFTSPYLVTSQSDRMGYRLDGPPLSLKVAKEMISEAVDYGTIQVPADGKPIILMADRQTTGGYPKIAQVASVDLPLVAQAKPGDKLFFHEISHEDAQRLYLERIMYLQQIQQSIQIKFQQS